MYYYIPYKEVLINIEVFTWIPRVLLKINLAADATFLLI